MPKKDGAPGSADARPQEDRRISAGKLKKLMSECRSATADMDELRSGIGGKISAAVEKENLNKKMFGWIRQLDNMTPEKLAANLDDFNHMLDISGLNARAASAPRLRLDAQGEEEEDGEDKVVQHPAAARAAAE